MMLRLLAVLLLVSCTPVPGPVPPEPAQDGALGVEDAGVPDALVEAALPVDAGDACHQACEQMTELNCPLGNASAGGVSCAEVCRVHNSPGDRWDTACLVRAKSCDAPCGRF